MPQIIIPEYDQKIRGHLRPLELSGYYLALMPDEESARKLPNLNLQRVHKLRTLVASDPKVVRFREYYLARLRQHDSGYKKSNHSANEPWHIWKSSEMGSRYQDALSRQMQQLEANSRFSLLLPEFERCRVFFKGFSHLDEAQLQQRLNQHGEQLLKPLFQLGQRICQRHLATMNPLTNFAILSPTSVLILQQVAEGASSAEIAEQLNLTERGVNYHIDRAKDLLGARNRIHLISLAHRMNVL